MWSELYTRRVTGRQKDADSEDGRTGGVILNSRACVLCWYAALYDKRLDEQGMF